MLPAFLLVLGFITAVMATIGIEGLEFQAYHGVYAQERKRGGKFVVDLYLAVEDDMVEAAAAQDDLKVTVDYASVTTLITREMQHPQNLLESLAQGLSQKLLDAFPAVRSVQIRVSKMHPPVGIPCERTYVEYKLLR